MHETLAALEGLDQSDVEQELVRRLADRASELAAPADPPSHIEELAERQGREAETELDPETELEVARYWFGGDAEFEPSLTVSGGRSSLALEIPAGVEQVDPPSMEEERADPDEIRELDLDIEELSPGSIEPHLPLSFQPEFVELPDRDLGPGEDRPVNLFPPDTRYVFRDTSFPWSATGRVETASGACAGTMVGTNLLLTAAHCVDWQDSGAGWLKFTPAHYSGNKPFGQAWGELLY
jgi:V8-like Glu-specific endopeptidase